MKLGVLHNCGVPFVVSIYFLRILLLFSFRVLFKIDVATVYKWSRGLTVCY